MLFKTTILIMLLLSLCLAAALAKTPLTIVVIPFQNNAGIDFNMFRQYIASYLIYLVDLLPGYTSVPLCSFLEYVKQMQYNLEDLKVQEIEAIAVHFQADFIIGGYFDIEENRLAVSIDIDKFTTSAFVLAENTYYFTMDNNNPNTLNPNMDQFLGIFDPGEEFNIEPAFLIVGTDAECSLFIDHVKHGNAHYLIPVTAGKHRVQIVHNSVTGDIAVHDETIDFIAGATHRIDKNIFTALSVTAGRMCRVLLDDEEKGVTPLKLYLYSGRTYQLKVEYTGEGNLPVAVCDESIATTGIPLERYFPAFSTLELESSTAFKAALAADTVYDLPCTFDSLLPGDYKLKIFLENPAGNNRWIFYDETLKIFPYNTLRLEFNDFDFKETQWMSYVPFLAQFRNKEPGKALLLTGLFAGAAVIGAWAAWNVVDNDNQIAVIQKLLMTDYIAENRRTELVADCIKAVNLSELNTNLVLCSGIAATVVTLFSLIDGIVTSEYINHQIYP